MLNLRRKKRNNIILFSLLFCIIVLGVIFLLSLLNDNIMFFYTPSQIKNIKQSSTRARIGGVLAKGSLRFFSQSKVFFFLKDENFSIEVLYQGKNFPMLFKEGQNIIVEGAFSDEKKTLFIASKIMVKHDEIYLPKKINEN